MIRVFSDRRCDVTWRDVLIVIEYELSRKLVYAFYLFRVHFNIFKSVQHPIVNWHACKSYAIPSFHHAKCLEPWALAKYRCAVVRCFQMDSHCALCKRNAHFSMESGLIPWLFACIHFKNDIKHLYLFIYFYTRSRSFHYKSFRIPFILTAELTPAH